MFDSRITADSRCVEASVVDGIFGIIPLTCLIVGHLFCSCGWYRVCLFASIPWIDGSIQSVSILFLLVLCCMLRLNLCAALEKYVAAFS
jgi:hypothetical protein